MINVEEQKRAGQAASEAESAQQKHLEAQKALEQLKSTHNTEMQRIDKEYAQKKVEGANGH